MLCQGIGVESTTWEPVSNLPKTVLNEYYKLQKQTVDMFAKQDDESDTFTHLILTTPFGGPFQEVVTLHNRCFVRVHGISDVCQHQLVQASDELLLVLVSVNLT